MLWNLLEEIHRVAWKNSNATSWRSCSPLVASCGRSGALRYTLTGSFFFTFVNELLYRRCRRLLSVQRGSYSTWCDPSNRSSSWLERPTFRYSASTLHCSSYQEWAHSCWRMLCTWAQSTVGNRCNHHSFKFGFAPPLVCSFCGTSQHHFHVNLLLTTSIGLKSKPY